MSWVWEQSRAKGSARLVLLALADHAGADGGDAYPSVRRLACRCGVSERTVQEALKALAELGEITVDANAGPRGVNRYRLTMTPAGSAPPQDLHPRNASQGPPQISHATPADPAPEPSGTVREPSPSSPSQSGSRGAVPASVWRTLAERKAATRGPNARPIADLAAWLDQTMENEQRNHNAYATWVWRTYKITESQLVAVLLGSTDLLNSLGKREAA